MILVTGATGALGSAVLAGLLQRTDAADVAVLVRDASRAADLADRGVSVRVGDYDDTAALDAAVAGVERVLLVASNDPDHERRVQQHQNAVDAAARAGVGLLGFTSRSLRDGSASVNPFMGDYLRTEERIAASGLPHLLFRNALYLDTVPLYVQGPRVFETGIRLPTGDGAVAYALRREMGEAIADAMLDHAGTSAARVIAAPRAYGFDDVAAALTEISGRTVTYTPVSDEEWLAGAVRAGVPEHRARQVLGFSCDIRDHQLEETSTDLQALLGREPAPLQQGLREVFGL
ncbi:NmrA family NAD(P)-binding protein [Quadrisphaera sp. DSM 44207]|uniref:NmrA family NAD(P)-binding protein n=1 Tax=Quadrisphaera sp. DSM 44207 TaxID=1881057 RepID=UPI0008925902|nr:NmrA family NAD(P)-binding protein [Quadrisphaera sp. DSM 44207]SDQ21336.1 NAD(P)H dehydrogenase (quinone) [Quadrisphaera sp. DSM 44207]